MFVVTADQRASRSHEDLVPGALQAVATAAGDSLSLPPERTAGDELQLLTADAAASLAVALMLVRKADWSVGIGVGSVETPLPAQTRAARGSAFIHARTAVTRAKSRATRFGLVADDRIGGEDAEALIALLIDLRERRTRQGWEVADLLKQGLTQQRSARMLEITPAAVSLRAKAAGLRIDEASVPALVRVLERLDGRDGRSSVAH